MGTPCTGSTRFLLEGPSPPQRFTVTPLFLFQSDTRRCSSCAWEEIVTCCSSQPTSGKHGRGTGHPLPNMSGHLGQRRVHHAVLPPVLLSVHLAVADSKPKCPHCKRRITSLVHSVQADDQFEELVISPSAVASANRPSVWAPITFAGGLHCGHLGTTLPEAPCSPPAPALLGAPGAGARLRGTAFGGAHLGERRHGEPAPLWP